MSEQRPGYRKPSKKHQPKGLRIIYEDIDIIVANKESGLLTISTEVEKEKTAYFMLTDYVKRGDSRSRNRIFIVHRLDRDTSGVLVFAKAPRVKKYLQDEWKEFSKTYLAVVNGTLNEKEGILSSYLLENKTHKMYDTKDSEQGKLAKTAYKVIRETANMSLVEISLLTGRKNQIRIQFAEIGHPIVGDSVYGKPQRGAKKLALHASSITINHPHTKEKMTFSTKAPEYFETYLSFEVPKPKTNKKVKK